MPNRAANDSSLFSRFYLFQWGSIGGVLLFCWGLYLREANHVKIVLLAEEANQVGAMARLFKYEMRPVADDLRQLAGGDALLAFLGDAAPRNLARATERAASYSRLKPEFDQIRFLDENGQEIIRVNHGGRIVASDQLQDKSDRVYFRKAFGLLPGQMYLSELDLNVENGELEQPIRPMLRFAMPVFDETHSRRGVYVINYSGADRLGSLQELRANFHHRTRILNAEGYWLQAAQPQDEWGFMFPDRKDRTLARTDPELWAQLTSAPNGQAFHDGGTFSWQRISLAECVGDDPMGAVVEDPYLILASEVSRRELANLMMRPRLVIGLLAVLLLAATYLIGRIVRSRSRAYAALRRSEENLAITLHSIGDAVLVTDANGAVTRMNEVAEKLTGWTSAEAKGTPVSHVLKLIHEETREAAVVPVEAALATGKVQSLDDHTSLIARDGTECPIDDSAAPILDSRGRVLGVVLVFRDVGAKRAADRSMGALRKELEDIKVALDHHAIVTVTDAAGHVTSANDKCCAVSGYSRDELLGKDLGIFNSGHHSKAFMADLWASISRGDVWQSEICNRAKDGSNYWMDMTIVPFVDPSGKPLQFVTVGTDITERRKAEAAIAEVNADMALANRKLDQASRLKDEFLANMSHELRTPLNAILGLSEALLEQISGPLNPRQTKSITTISSSGHHLLSLINDILDLSKIEAAKVDLHFESINVREFCESCLVFVRPQAAAKKITVDCQIDDQAKGFMADPRRCKQILVNLLSNAVKFTPEGRRVGLDVSLLEDEQSMKFVVWDTGIGIAAEDQSKLFQAFSQLDSGLARNQNGTGLGLALVAKLTELHGGGVSLESEVGTGSRFTVTIPQAALHIRAREKTPITPTDRKDYHRALIIEDDPNTSDQLGRYLTELGVTSVIHAEGEKSVEAALREKPDVILLDIMLPNESGWVVLAKLKEHPGTRGIPVVVNSVHDEPHKSRALGAAAHYTKPITREQLADFFQRPAKAPAASDTPIPKTVSPAEGPLVLLAEDNAANRETVGGYLEDRGYTMLYAVNGQEAVQIACGIKPAVILMDVQMPVMDGLTAIEKIRADAALSETPIVALTALAMPGDRERCLATGATEYVSKPVSMKVLMALMERLAPIRGVPGEN